MLALVALAGAAACATPSRRLPTRLVDDPITLPRRMISVSAGVRTTPANEWREGQMQTLGGVRYGVTDRITLEGPLVLDVALLDDAPVQSAATGLRAAEAPIALALHGGLAGVGYSSWDGTILQPALGFRIARHLGERSRLHLTSTWYGSHSERWNDCWLYGVLGYTLQVTERVAVSLSLFDDWNLDTFLPSRRWIRHGLGVGPGVGIRPLHWLTVGADVRVERIWRARQEIPLGDPTASGVPMPRRTRAVAAWGRLSASAHW
jgi:hypothetical protein